MSIEDSDAVEQHIAAKRWADARQALAGDAQACKPWLALIDALEHGDDQPRLALGLPKKSDLKYSDVQRAFRYRYVYA